MVAWQGGAEEPDARADGDVDASGSERPPRDAQPRARGRRRVTQAAPEGSDPHPFDPPEAPRSGSENDDRLKADKPPHWG